MNQLISRFSQVRVCSTWTVQAAESHLGKVAVVPPVRHADDDDHNRHHVNHRCEGFVGDLLILFDILKNKRACPRWPTATHE